MYILSQTTHQTINVGNNAAFTLSTNYSNPSFQWQMNTGSGFQDIINSGQFSGCTTNNLVISDVEIKNNNSKFRCLITNGTCKDTSGIAKLFVNCILSFSNQPDDDEIYVGQAAVFYTMSNTANSNYQWQTDLGFGFQSISDAGQFFGATSDVLYVSHATQANHNQKFRCIINSAGCTDTSDVATLIIRDKPTDIRELNSNQTFRLFPNKIQDQLHIHLNQALSIFPSYNIYNLQGQQLLTGTLEATDTYINTSQLPAGIYYIKLNDEPHSPSQSFVKF